MAKVKPETTEVSADEINEILNAFNDASDAGKSEDDVKMAMIGAGATFKNVTRLFNQYMVDTGKAISREAKAELVEKHADGADLADEAGFNEAVASIVSEGTGVSEASASSLIRAWAKKAEVECYAKPKGTGATRNPFVVNFHNALIANPSMDEQGLKDVIAALEPQQQVNPTRWFNQHNAIRKMVNKIAGGQAEAA